jgi:hypothetical protein
LHSINVRFVMRFLMQISLPGIPTINWPLWNNRHPNTRPQKAKTTSKTPSQVSNALGQRPIGREIFCGWTGVV